MTPPSDREIALCKMFESFCLTAIRNFGRNLKRAMKNRKKHDGTSKESVEYLIGLRSSEDRYASEQFVLDVGGLPCVLENELPDCQEYLRFPKDRLPRAAKNLNRLHLLFASANLYMLASAGGSLSPVWSYCAF